MTGADVGAGAATDAPAVRPLSRPYVIATAATGALAGGAAAAGLLVEGLYRDAAALLPQLYGQDLLTLVVAVPALAVSCWVAARGSRRGYVVWLGVTGYLLYTYASYAFMAAFNELYLAYVALLALTLFTLVGGLARVDPEAMRATLGDHPVRAYVAYLLVVAGLVAALWLSEIVPATLDGSVPASVADASVPTNVIHTLDLGVLLPAAAVTAWLLWRGRAWGYAFAGVLLVKATTLGLAVLSMIGFMVRDGQTVVLPQVVIFTALSAAGVVLTARFVRELGRGEAATLGSSTSPTGVSTDGHEAR